MASPSASPFTAPSTAHDDSAREQGNDLSLNYHVHLSENPLQFPSGSRFVYFDRCNRQVVVTRDKEVRRIPLRKDRDDVRISSIRYGARTAAVVTRAMMPLTTGHEADVPATPAKRPEVAMQ